MNLFRKNRGTVIIPVQPLPPFDRCLLQTPTLLSTKTFYASLFSILSGVSLFIAKEVGPAVVAIIQGVLGICLRDALSKITHPPAPSTSVR